MTSTNTANLVTTTVTTPLSAPYYYRRHGVYYLRLRPVGSLKGHAVSLRTTDRAHAMTTSKNLRHALAGFHLDNPKATWEEIREAIAEFATEALEMTHGADPMQSYGMVYQDLKADLRGHAMTASMSPLQSHGLDTAITAVDGALSRLNGNLKPLNGLLQDLSGPQAGLPGDSKDLQDCLAPNPVGLRPSLSPSVKGFDPKGIIESSLESSLAASTLKESVGVTFRTLADSYLGEHEGNVKATTLKGLKASLNGLCAALGEIDMLTHTRDHMTTLKASLSEQRSNATVNKMLSILQTVLEWAVNTGTIERHYAKGLKFKRDVASDRKAFTEAQVGTIMSKAQEDHSDASLVIQLAALTGARLNEILTLTKEDVREVAGVTVIDINESHAHKSLKNKGSARLVPLVSAYGFDLEGFLKLVSELPEGAALFKVTTNTGRAVNAKLRTFHGLDDTALVLHSLRHSLATSMKTQGVKLEHAQLILGHASGSITWDTYGRNATADLGALKAALETAHTMTNEVTQ